MRNFPSFGRKIGQKIGYKIGNALAWGADTIGQVVVPITDPLLAATQYLFQRTSTALNNLLNYPVKDFSSAAASSTQRDSLCGRGWGFNGSTQYGDISNSIVSTDVQATGGVSVTVWAKRNGNPGSANMLFAHRDSGTELLQLSLHSANGVTVQHRDSGNSITTTQNTTIDHTIYHHYVATWDFITSTQKLYVDSVELESDSITASGTLSSAKTLLGAFNAGAANSGYANAHMNRCGVKVGAVLTQNDVDALYSNTYDVTQLDAFYNAEEGVGTTAFDSSGNGNDGTLMNGVTHITDADIDYSFGDTFGYTAGNGSNGAAVGVAIPRDESNPTQDVLGNALQYSGRVPYNADLVGSNCGNFDGVNGHIALTETLTLTDFTFFCRMNMISIRQILIANNSNNDNFIFLESSSSPSNNIRINASGTVVNIAHNLGFTTGEDQDICVRRSSNTITIFKDGIASSVTGTLSTDLVINDFGRYGAASFEPYGEYYDVRVYDSALTDEQILQIHNQEHIVAPKVHYPLAEGSGTTIYDASGNDNDGTATNITPSAFWGTQDVYHHNIENGFSQAIAFGSEEYDSYGNEQTQNLLDDFTFLVWYNSTNTDTKNVVLCYDDQNYQHSWTVETSSSNALVSAVTADSAGTQDYISATGTTNIDDGNDHLIGFSFLNGTIYCYTDGVLQSSDSAPAGYEIINTISGITYDKQLFIGNHPFFGGGTFQAANPILLNTALSEAQHLLLYSGTNNYESNQLDLQKIYQGGTPIGPRYPVAADGTPTKFYGRASNIAGDYHNGAETKLQQQCAPALLHPKYVQNLVLNGTNNFVNFGSQLDLANLGTQFTFSINYTPSVVDSSFRRVVSKDGNLVLYQFNDNTMLFWLRDNTPAWIAAVATTLPVVGEKRHYTCVKEASQIKIYVDGKVEATTSFTNPLLADFLLPTYVGANGDSSSLLIGGDVSDFRVWNAAKNEREVMDIFLGKRDETNLIFESRMNDGSGTTITAQVGTDGTLVGTTTNCWQERHPELWFNADGTAKEVAHTALKQNYDQLNRDFANVEVVNRIDSIAHFNEEQS